MTKQQHDWREELHEAMRKWFFSVHSINDEVKTTSRKKENVFQVVEKALSQQQKHYEEKIEKAEYKMQTLLPTENSYGYKCAFCSEPLLANTECDCEKYKIRKEAIEDCLEILEEYK